MPQTPCPYCGHPHDTSDVTRCSNCNGLFEPLSQIATQLAMGPWFVRDEDRPFMPGFNEAILVQQVRAGRITANTIVRGPTTNQFWMNAADVQGVSRLMGTCHACHQAVEPTDTACQFCKADLSLPSDVDALGLKYTTDELRAAAQQEIAAGQAAQPAPKPAAQPKPTPPPAAPKTTPVAAASPSQSTTAPTQPEQPAPPPAPPAQPAASDEDDNELTSALAEDVWQAGPTQASRRRNRQKGPDPLALGMGVLLLCVIAFGMLILLTSDGKSDDEEDANPIAETEPTRDSVDVSRISVPALVAYERLEQGEVPEEFADRYAEIEKLKKQAESDKASENFNDAYDAYKELGELILPLESEIAQWQANEQAKAEATEVRARIEGLRKKAQDAEAERWAAKEWQDAQGTFDKADQLFVAGKYVEASDLFAQSESNYLAAENKALAGQVANRSRTELMDAMKAGGSEQTLRKFASDQIEAMLRLRAEADGFLNDQEYAKAEQAYNSALDTLKQAQQMVELARYKKYYAFEAGFQASGLMLSAARGDGVSSESQKSLAELFDKLRILPNPAASIKPGDEVGFTVAINPLVNDARDKITQQHGEEVQACYLIGFHASIIDQTLKTIELSDEQQKRIHQSLGTIEQEAIKAGWNINAVRPIIEQIRTTNRNAKLKQAPESTRAAWQNMIAPLQSKAAAPRLMDPSHTSEDADDPELFPTNG